MLFADLALAQRLEAAEARKYLDYAATRGRLHPEQAPAWEPIAGGYAVYAGAGNPYSRVIGIGFHGSVSAADFGRLEEFYAVRGLTPEFNLCPLADESLLHYLSGTSRASVNSGGPSSEPSKGCYHVEIFMHTWYRPLSPGETFPPPAPGVVVRPIAPDEADLWVLTSIRGFAGEDAIVPQDSIVAAYPHMAHAVCYLAWLDGDAWPAGAGTLAIHGGAAELFGTSTRPSCRGRGVQTALMHARMAAAVAAGCDLISVHTTPGSDSQRNVERAGFRLAYTKVMMRDGDE